MIVGDLIFDVGMHKCEDTIFYLKKGYRVISIEANPHLVAIAQQKFKREIETERLTILNFGIAENEGTLPFYRNDHLLEWSSFDKLIGTRDNTPFTVIDVPCKTILSIINEFGSPFYLKIDIEGYDQFCIASLDATKPLPTYISCEASSIDCLNSLVEKGYTQFKLLNQARNFKPFDLSQEQNNTSIFFQMKWNRLKMRLQKYFPFQYNYGSSGPFAEATLGEWVSADSIRTMYYQFYTKDTNQPLNGLSWFDIHAKK